MGEIFKPMRNFPGLIRGGRGSFLGGLARKTLVIGCILVLVFGPFTCLGGICGTAMAEKAMGNVPWKGLLSANFQRNSFPVIVTDDLGRKVTIEKMPVRIVSLAPSNTEILFALGLGGRVVGVTTYCNYPEEAKKKEKIGGFSNPSIEKIVFLEPDLVVAASIHKDLIGQVEQLGVPVILLDTKSISGVLRSIQLVGRATGENQAAARLVMDLARRIDGVSRKVRSLPLRGRPRVFYEVWYEPIMTAGPGSLIDDLISLAGGVNIAHDAGVAYPEYSLEFLIMRNPEVMIHSYGHADSSASTKEEIAKRRAWGSILAVEKGRIYFVNADLVTRPSPRIVDGLEEMAKAIHPELFQ